MGSELYRDMMPWACFAFPFWIHRAARSRQCRGRALAYGMLSYEPKGWANRNESSPSLPVFFVQFRVPVERQLIQMGRGLTVVILLLS